MKLSAWLNMSFVVFFLWIPAPALSQADFWQAAGGPLGADISCMLVEADTIIVGDRYNGTHISSDQGATWMHSGPDSIPALAIARHPNRTLFLGTLQHGIWSSTNGGSNWSQCGLSSADVSAITVDDSGYVLAGTRTSGIFRSTDNGLSWSQQLNTSREVEAIIVAPNGGIFAGTDWGVFRSTDNGSNWTRVFSNNFEIFGPHAMARGLSGAVYAGFTFSGIYYGCSIGVAASTNGGDDWTREFVSSFWSDDCLYIRAIVVNHSGALFAGSSRGVVRSTDGGTTWQQVRSGLTDTTVTSLGVNPQGYIFAGTTTGGVYRSVQSTTSVPRAGDLGAQQFTLHQNYPNPFNPQTTITFSVPYRCYVTLKLFDPLGREVDVLFGGETPAGLHVIEWNATHNPSGMYFCRMQAGAFSQTVRLLLIK
jgi:photosystem II stability/assembly factor-like uncharacterized protein